MRMRSPPFGGYYQDRSVLPNLGATRVDAGRGLARHYPRDMAPFSAVAEPTARAYADLAADLEPATEARLFRPREEPAPAGWDTLSARPIIQMIAEKRPAGRHPNATPAISI